MSANKMVYYVPTFDKRMVRVAILDVYEVAGISLVSVKALDGRPFVGGDKWPVRTEFATVEAVLIEVASPAEIKPLVPALEGAA